MSLDQKITLAGWGQYFLKFVLPLLFMLRLHSKRQEMTLRARLFSSVLACWILSAVYRSGVILPLGIQRIERDGLPPLASLEGQLFLALTDWVHPLIVCGLFAFASLIVKHWNERKQSKP